VISYYTRRHPDLWVVACPPAHLKVTLDVSPKPRQQLELAVASPGIRDAVDLRGTTNTPNRDNVHRRILSRHSQRAQNKRVWLEGNLEVSGDTDGPTPLVSKELRDEI
jgi:hypothetical protein